MKFCKPYNYSTTTSTSIAYRSNPIFYLVGIDPENFVKKYSIVQKLDHLTCRAGSGISERGVFPNIAIPGFTFMIHRTWWMNFADYSVNSQSIFIKFYTHYFPFMS